MRTQACSNEGPHLFPRGDKYEIVKIHWRNLKVFSRITVPISTKLGTMPLWVMRIQVCLSEGPIGNPFPRGDNCEIAKFKNPLLQNPSANFKQAWHNASLGDEDSSLCKWKPFSKGRWSRNSENTLTKFQNLLLQNRWANFNQIWQKASFCEGESSLFKWRTIQFS